MADRGAGAEPVHNGLLRHVQVLVLVDEEVRVLFALRRVPVLQVAQQLRDELVDQHGAVEGEPGREMVLEGRFCSTDVLSRFVPLAERPGSRVLHDGGALLAFAARRQVREERVELESVERPRAAPARLEEPALSQYAHGEPVQRPATQLVGMRRSDGDELAMEIGGGDARERRRQNVAGIDAVLEQPRDAPLLGVMTRMRGSAAAAIW